MITREEALNVINDLINSEILSEDLEYALSDIRMCIEEEMIGRHVWGIPDEWMAKLHTSVRADLVTDELIDEYDNIHKGIAFKPSTFETKEIRDNVRADIENASGEDATDEQIDWFLAK